MCTPLYSSAFHWHLLVYLFPNFLTTFISLSKSIGSPISAMYIQICVTFTSIQGTSSNPPKTRDYTLLSSSQMTIYQKLGVLPQQSLTIELQYFKNIVILCSVRKAEVTGSKVDVLTLVEHFCYPPLTFYYVDPSNHLAISHILIL